MGEWDDALWDDGLWLGEDEPYPPIAAVGQMDRQETGATRLVRQE